MEGIFQEERPLVSVIMPAYNAAGYIGRTISSLQRQTYQNWELLILDDGSCDGTGNVVDQYAAKDPRIKLLINEKNMGTAKTRNRGLDLCNGKYVAFLDSDDLWHPSKLEAQVETARKEKADLLYTSYGIIDYEDKHHGRDYIVPRHTDVEHLLKENVIGCSTVMLSDRVYTKYRFSSQYYHEDFVMWLEILRDGGKAVGIPDVLVDYRFHENSRAANKLASAKQRWRIYRDFMKLSVLRSAYYLMHYAVAGVMKYRRG